jgi:large subunit ribosomal protein L11
MDFCKKFNARTEDQKGKLLPVEITVYKDKSFDFIIKTPPASAQLLEASKLQQGSPEAGRSMVGSVTWDQVKAIAEDKLKDLNTDDVEAAMRTVAGTAKSMGLTVQGPPPWEKNNS